MQILIKDPDFKDVTKMFLMKLKSDKDAGKSDRLRDLGNKNFQGKQPEEALRYYSEAVLAGPVENQLGREVALALGSNKIHLSLDHCF